MSGDLSSVPSQETRTKEISHAEKETCSSTSMDHKARACRYEFSRALSRGFFFPSVRCYVVAEKQYWLDWRVHRLNDWIIYWSMDRSIYGLVSFCRHDSTPTSCRRSRKNEVSVPTQGIPFRFRHPGPRWSIFIFLSNEGEAFLFSCQIKWRWSILIFLSDQELCSCQV